MARGDACPGAGPVLDLTTSADGQTEIVRNGDVMATIGVPSDASSLSYTLPVAAGQWLHVRLRDLTGITAFSNPIYVK